MALPSPNIKQKEQGLMIWDLRMNIENGKFNAEDAPRTGKRRGRERKAVVKGKEKE